MRVGLGIVVLVAIVVLLTQAVILVTTMLKVDDVAVQVDRIDRAAANADARTLEIGERLNEIEAGMASDVGALVDPMQELARSVRELEGVVAVLTDEENVSCLFGAFPDEALFLAYYNDVGAPPADMTAMYLCGEGQRFYTFLPVGASVSNPLAAPKVHDDGG